MKIEEKLQMLRCDIINVHCDNEIDRAETLYRQMMCIRNTAKDITKALKKHYKEKLDEIEVTFTRNPSDYQQGFDDGQDHMLTEIQLRFELQRGKE